jgi:hypothetical protein
MTNVWFSVNLFKEIEVKSCQNNLRIRTCLSGKQAQMCMTFMIRIESLPYFKGALMNNR